MIKGFYGGLFEMPIPFSDWNNFDLILDLLDDYIELVEEFEEDDNKREVEIRVDNDNPLVYKYGEKQ